MGADAVPLVIKAFIKHNFTSLSRSLGAGGAKLNFPALKDASLRFIFPLIAQE